MSVFVGAPFASGILVVGTKSGHHPRYMYEPASEAIIAKVRQMEEICDKHSVTLAAAALQFPLFHPRVACVLSGVKCEAEVRSASESINADIPEHFWRELKANGLIRPDAPIAG